MAGRGIPDTATEPLSPEELVEARDMALRMTNHGEADVENLGYLLLRLVNTVTGKAESTTEEKP
jgi:hypothetical protein